MSDSGEMKEGEILETKEGTEQEENDSLLSVEEVRAFLVAEQQGSLLRRALQSSEFCCSYADGYKTQSLLSCLTCSRQLQQLDPSAPPQYVAVCIACVMHCHDDHELEDVNSKRDMRCDCPTLAARHQQAAASASATTAAAVPALPVCKLNPAASAPPNAHNAYGQNFSGLYCRCSAAFDPETETSDMYQCLMCEDWFHQRCINTEHNAPEDSDRFLCRGCIGREEWRLLVPYWAAAKAPPVAEDDEKEAAALESEEAEAVAEREEKEGSTDAVVDLFPEVTARQRREKEERLLRLQSGAVTAGAEQKQKADAVPGWSCAHCGFFNQPQEEQCFGCEKPRATADSERGSTAAAAIAASSSSAASLPLPSSASTREAEGEDDVCRRLTTVPASFSLSPPRDQWLLASWLDEACRCSRCLPLFQAHAPFLLHPDNDLRDDGDDGDPLSVPTTASVSDAASAIVNKYLASQPRARVLDSIADMQEWTDGMLAGLQAATERAAAGGAALITAEMVRTIADELLDAMKKKRRRQAEGDDEEERGREGRGGGGGGGDGADGSKRGRFQE